jgi:hypothetical protein
MLLSFVLVVVTIAISTITGRWVYPFILAFGRKWIADLSQLAKGRSPRFVG